MCVAAEEKLAAKGEEAEGLRAQVARLEADLENAMRMQEELLQENEHAAAEFEKMLSQVHRSALRDHVDADQVDSLVAEVERLKTEALALTSERNDLRAKLARAPEAHHYDAPLAVADGAGNQAQQIAALEVSDRFFVDTRAKSLVESLAGRGAMHRKSVGMILVGPRQINHARSCADG